MMDIQAFQAMLRRSAFPDASKEALTQAAEKAFREEAFTALCTEERPLRPAEESAATEKALHAAAEKIGVPDNMLNMVWLLTALPVLEKIYTEKGYAPDVFDGMLTDFACKERECRMMHGYPGTRALAWHLGFFQQMRFALGRLQYEPRGWLYREFVSAGHVIHPGDPLIAIHIPSGLPFGREARLASYRRAFEFFGCTREKPLILSCSSWLISPDHLLMLPKESNIVDFIGDFDMVERAENETFINAWRVFGPAAEKPLDEWPTDNAFRRAYVDWLKAGKKTAVGRGVAIFDGEKLLTGTHKG